MSKLATALVVRCKAPQGCTALVALADVQTFESDPDGTKLQELARAAIDKALCPWHQSQLAYWAKAGLAEHWWKGVVP